MTPTRRLPAPLAAVFALLLVVVGCSSSERAGRGGTSAGPDAGVPTTTSAPPTVLPSVPATATPAPAPRQVRPADLRVATAMRAVRHLAGEVGPRLATGPAYGRAAAWVATELRRHGFVVRRQRVHVPAGDSWGVPVEAGTSWNLVATPPDFERHEPHLVVGAHLDTVAVSPGAEDNASGVGVLLAVAEAVAGRETPLPVVFVAFGAEELRGPSDADHHYGSRAYVASMGRSERRALRGMVSLDRVGVGSVVPVGSASPSGTDHSQRRVLAAARRAGMPTVAGHNRSSDHWSFARAGLGGVRLGSTPYAGYHSSADLPSAISAAQLRRVGRIVLAWLAR